MSYRRIVEADPTVRERPRDTDGGVHLSIRENSLGPRRTDPGSGTVNLLSGKDVKQMNLIPVGEFLILAFTGAVASGFVIWLCGDIDKWRD